MIASSSSIRSPLAWLKSQFGEPSRPAESERRSSPRRKMRFEAEIQRFDGTTSVIGVDIHEDGARVLSKRNWANGTLLFLKLTEVQLGGFVEVRHSTLRNDG